MNLRPTWRRANGRRPDRTRFVGETARRLLSAALERRNRRDRLIIALLLVERLSPAEAADVLGISVTRVRDLYRDALAALERAARGETASASVRERTRRSVLGEARLRKAS